MQAGDVPRGHRALVDLQSPLLTWTQLHLGLRVILLQDHALFVDKKMVR